MSIIQITKTGTKFLGADNDIKLMSSEFNQNHHMKLFNFLDTELLNFIQFYVNNSGFIETPNELGLGIETCIKDNPALHLLHFLMNDQKLYRIIEQITGCEKIGCFDGRIYHVTSEHKGYDRWHDDNGRTRMVAVSINLSPGLYSGGTLQIRDADSKKILHKVPNTGYGDTVIFRISSHLEHMVTDVDSKAKKIAYAGWFHKEPDHFSLVKNKFALLDNKSPRVKKIDFEISMESQIAVKKGYFSHELDGECVVFKPEDLSYYVLDPIGISIWKCIQKPCTLRDIIACVLSEYDVTPIQCEKDIVNLLQSLAANDLIDLNANKPQMKSSKDFSRI